MSHSNRVIKEFDNDKDFEEFLINLFSDHKYELHEERTYKNDNPYEDEYRFYRSYEHMPKFESLQELT